MRAYFCDSIWFRIGAVSTAAWVGMCLHLHADEKTAGESPGNDVIAFDDLDYSFGPLREADDVTESKQAK